jgi:hypothetical protein
MMATNSINSQEADGTEDKKVVFLDAALIGNILVWIQPRAKTMI